jgi:hypothetical protein
VLALASAVFFQLQSDPNICRSSARARIDRIGAPRSMLAQDESETEQDNNLPRRAARQ